MPGRTRPHHKECLELGRNAITERQELRGYFASELRTCLSKLGYAA